MDLESTVRSPLYWTLQNRVMDLEQELRRGTLEPKEELVISIADDDGHICEDVHCR